MLFRSSNFKDIIIAIRKINHKAIFLVTTNARLMNPEMTDFLLENAPIFITFSLHAAREDVYSKVMGNGFTEAVQNIRYFCHKSSDKHDVGTGINYGLGKFNYHDAEKMVRLAKEMNIRILHMYPYYKSPNKFLEDVSLYDSPDLANQALTNSYKVAKEIGQRMEPANPVYLRSENGLELKESPYRGGCILPYENLNMKSTPTMKNSWF